MFAWLIDWLFNKPKKQEVALELHEQPDYIHPLCKPQTNKYLCEVCKYPAQHLAIMKSDTGDHVVAAKCEKHLPNMMSLMIRPSLDPLNIMHYAGFIDKDYIRWYECGCPIGVSHKVQKSIEAQ